MLDKILVPTDFSRHSNSIFPFAVTLAQAFHSKLYLVHVMHPSSLQEPERLEDFPRMSKFIATATEEPGLPPLKKNITVARMYAYDKNVPRVIAHTAKEKKIDLICMASTSARVNYAWWSAGRSIEQVLKTAPCSVLCLRGRDIKETAWQRPRFQNILWLGEIEPNDAEPFLKILPFVHKFNSILHVFPLMTGTSRLDQSEHPLREVAQLNAGKTNVLLFAEPKNRMQNLLSFVKRTPPDLIAMAPRTRTQFASWLVSDVLVKLLAATECPVLMMR